MMLILTSALSKRRYWCVGSRGHICPADDVIRQSCQCSSRQYQHGSWNVPRGKYVWVADDLETTPSSGKLLFVAFGKDTAIVKDGEHLCIIFIITT